MKYFSVFTVTSEPFIPEILSGLLWELEISGLTEETDCIKIFIDEEKNKIENEIHILLEKLVHEKVIKSFKVSKNILEDKNWNEIWENSRQVIHVTDRIIIKPSFREYSPRKNEIVITIDPKMSFGTGEHQTTKLMLALLEKNITDGCKVLDLGSGTGILAIAAVKLDASKVFALDNDETCYENCKENCELNNVSRFVEIVTGEIDDVKENNFDIIFANIQKNVLVELAGSIKSKIKNYGKVLLSGLLAGDRLEIEQCYHFLGFKTECVEMMDEWIAVVFNSEK